MGDTQTGRRRITALRGGGAVLASVALLTGCAAAEAEAPVPTVTVTATAEPLDRTAGEQDLSASYACGRYTSLFSLEWTMRWFRDSGEVSEESYRSFLERQAFQLSTVRSDDPAITASVTAIRDHLRQAETAAGRWTYDPVADDWSALVTELSGDCADAGSEIASWAEPEMGG
ncbi:hypothetical protein GRS96_13795 [Rathayibacter sp. VKM Ac-2803]|uniref:hypothetical protein n=1 Tax=Rathayibacter sp. VKM Ac-2803 TaxID=2609256 RepID=UPI00135994F7|nr:hypothetical protein [Rathayibacter sp. VKM Ac-2803]MWV50341.1 hypothetical protein [Rathayibacter sp. VKM Ac-2803]